MDLSNLKRIQQENAQKALGEKQHNELLLDNTNTQEVIVKSFASLVRYLDNKVTKAEVVNQLREVGTPDVEKVVTALDSLHDTIKQHKNVDLGEITSVMRGVLDEVKQIPKENPDTPEQKFVDYSKQLKALEESVKTVEKAIKAQELKVDAPIVNVPETVVNVPKTDLKPIEKSITTSSKDVVKAVKGIKIPEFKTKSIEDLLKKTNKLLNDLPDYMPSGGHSGSSWVAVDSNGIPAPIQLDADGNLPTTGSGGGSSTTVIDPRTGYAISDTESTATYKYFGFEDADGKWYILRKTIATKIFLYAAGTTGYTTAWTNRASQTYATFDTTFSPVTGSVITSLTDLIVKEKSPTATLSNVSGSASSVTLLASNANRRGATIQNDSSAVLYVKFGATASTTSYTVKMVADSYYEIPFGYTGIIDGIWASATGSARITEMS